MPDIATLIPIVKALVRGGWLSPAGANWIALVLDLLAGRFADRIREYQHYFGLPETGEPDPATLAHLSLPRICALTDRLPDSLPAGTLPVPGGVVRFNWSNPGQLTGLPASEVSAAYAYAWAQLAGVCGIEVQGVDSSSANARAQAGMIDGTYGVLAWSELGNGSVGPYRQMYDSGDAWIVRSGELPASVAGIDLRRVAMHECIHLLGFGHDDSTPCLMNATYSRSIDRPNSHDVRRLQSVYGPPKAAPPPEPPPGPPLPPGPTPDSTKHYLSVVAIPVRDSGQRVIGYLEPGDYPIRLRPR